MNAEAPSDGDGLLAIYLRDHHAAATAGSAVANRLAQAVTLGPNARQELAATADAIATDLRTLEGIMADANVAPAAIKDLLARTGAALGRLKLNGRIRERSPLSDVIELEAMLAGVTAKAALWNTLKTLPLRTDADLDELSARAKAQSATLARWKDTAAARTFHP